MNASFLLMPLCAAGALHAAAVATASRRRSASLFADACAIQAVLWLTVLAVAVAAASGLFAFGSCQ